MGRKADRIVTAVVASVGEGYADGDQVGVPVKLTNSVTDKGGVGEIATATVVSNNASTVVGCDLMIFDSQPTMASGNNDAVDANAAAAAKLLATINIPTSRWRSHGTTSSGDADPSTELKKIKPLLNTGQDLWLVYVVRGGTPTFLASGLKVILGFND